MRPRPLLAILLALSLAAPAAAQNSVQATTLPDPPRPKAERDGLRGAPTGAADKSGARSGVGPADPGAARPRAPAQALMSPGLVIPAAPRLDRTLEATTGGGAQCRTKCAQEKYFCLGGDEGGGCDESWRKCVLACPLQSAPGLAAGAP